MTKTRQTAIAVLSAVHDLRTRQKNESLSENMLGYMTAIASLTAKEGAVGFPNSAIATFLGLTSPTSVNYGAMDKLKKYEYTTTTRRRNAQKILVSYYNLTEEGFQVLRHSRILAMGPT